MAGARRDGSDGLGFAEAEAGLRGVVKENSSLSRAPVSSHLDVTSSRSLAVPNVSAHGTRFTGLSVTRPGC